MHRSNVYRAVVQEANRNTGRITVTIPGIAGPASRFQVTALGRDDVEGTWKVPPVGSVVLVAAEDEDLTTLFLVQTYTYDPVVRATDVYGDFHGPVVVVARNDTENTIPAGKVVYDTADGQELVIAVANANNTGKMPVLGITVEDIAPNKSGKVAVAGFLAPFDTSGLAAGVDIYAGTNGNLTTNPVGMAVAQIVAKVVEVGATGSLVVNVYPPGITTGSSGNYDGIFSGTIYAAAGVLGGQTEGWVIAPDRIESYGSGDKIVLDGKDGEIYVGTYGIGASANPSTAFYVNKDGMFSLGNKLVWNGSTLDVNGTITAEDGQIGGWTIDGTSLHAGSGGSYVSMSSGGSVAFWAGATASSAAPFRVTNTGYLTATGVDLNGTFVATAGSIGDWAINGSTLQSSGATKIVLDSGNGKIYVGNSNWGNPANGFYVDNTGKFGLSDNLTWEPTAASGAGRLLLNGQIDANSATFAGWSLEQYRLYAGTAGNYIELNADPVVEYRTWAGHPTAASAPFSVRSNGFVTASSSTVNLYETNRVLGRLVVASTGASMYLGSSVNANGDSGLWIDTNNYWYNTGTFRLGSATNYVSWNGSTLGVAGDIYATNGSFNGQINATSASIGGWTTNSSAFTGPSVGMIPGSYPFYAGSTTASAAPFRVTNSGGLFASSATITGGTISIGGSNAFNVGVDGSVNIGGTAGLYIDNTGNLWTNSSSSVSASFLVESSGNVRIGTSGLFVKTPTNASDGLIYVGDSTDASTNFRITKGGQVDIGGTSASTSFHVSPEGHVWVGAGTSGSATAPFLLQSIGQIRIGGTDNTSLNIKPNGDVFTGASTYSTAPFRLQASTGTVTASSVIATGTISGRATHLDKTSVLHIDDLVAIGSRSIIATSGSAYNNGINFILNASDGFEGRFNSTTSLRINDNGFLGPGQSSTIPSSKTRPAFTFVGDDDTGIFQPSENTVGITAGGSELIRFDSSNNLRIVDGSAAVPAINFIDDGNTGIYRSTTDTLAISANGASVAKFSSSGITGTEASFTTLSLTNGGANALLVADLQTASTTQTAVAINSSNQFRRQSSSQDIKTNIVPLTSSPLQGVDAAKIVDLQNPTDCCTASAYLSTDLYAVLDLSPVLFESLVADEAGVATLGLIAEDVYAKFPLAAVMDSGGKPISWSPNPAVAALIGVVRDLRSRIEQLEAQLP